jgi:hypothetical protein
MNHGRGKTVQQHRRPKIGAYRAARVFDEMVSVRRLLMDDHNFSKMTDVWKTLFEECDGFSLKTYAATEGTVADFKAGVTSLGDRVTLIASEGLWARAEKGSLLANSTLAHELAHVALGHHLRKAKHFKMKTTEHGFRNEPKDDVELEANLGAVFFQCGVSLFISDVDYTSLAKQAFADVHQTKKALDYVRLDSFRRELQALISRRVRVVL